MQTSTSENNKLSSTPTITLDPGPRIRRIVLSFSIPLLCIGILLLCLAGAETSYGYWGETHLTSDGIRFLGIGSFLAAIGTSILLPGLSYAAWKTSHDAVEKIRDLLSKPDQLAPCNTDMEILAGSTSAWASWWLFFVLINVIGIVVGLSSFLSGSEDAILLPSAGYALPLTASAYVYSAMLGWFLHVMMSTQAKNADSIRHLYRERFQPTIDVDALISELVPIPDKGYKVGRTQVTQAQWMAVMGDNPSHIKGADNPVENVSWIDCQSFLTKLNDLPSVKASGLVFRLLTDAEWEYACRAGATGNYCKLADGMEITVETLGQVAWYADNSNGRTHPVGEKLPNAFGLYDMHGNVWEWCQDGGDVWEWCQDGGDFAKDKDLQHYRVYCGGGWGNSAGSCESSNRSGNSPDYRNDYLGFRLCADEP